MATRVEDFIDIKPSNFIGTYPPVDSPTLQVGLSPTLGRVYGTLQYDLFKKKEFHDLKLDRFEAAPSVNGSYKNQVIIERFMSDKTMYDVLLLVHGLGTGKTRTSILVAEINRRVYPQGMTFSEVPLDRRPLILTRNRLLYENYQEELVKYDPETYAPKNARGQLIDRTRDEKTYKSRRTVFTERYYEFNTFARFATTLGGREATTRVTKKGKPIKIPAVVALTDQEIIDRYSHRVIIIDEAHNIRVASDDKDDEGVSAEIYNQIHRFLHLVKGAKILLLTATPIWDQAREIASLMNLILPLNQQLDYDNFDKKYFSSNDKLKHREDLRKAFFGRVSFVRQMQSEVIKDYQGEKLEGGKAAGEGLKIFTSEMSKFQYKGELRGAEGENAYNINERNAANFVFPDGTFRREGFDKHIEKIPEQTESRSLEKQVKGEPRYRFKKNVDEKDLKDNLGKYSQKFKDTIDNIREHPDENAFVFFEFHKGSNSILFGLLLQLYGYKRLMRPKGVFNKPEKRYILISSETPVTEELIRAFNDPRNKNGEYIQVLIGTRKMAEGITLKNVLQTHIMMPHFHTAYIDQAIGRTVRLGSHTALGLDVVKVKIYLHASAYKEKKTIDIRLYLRSEEKDYRAAQVYREVKKSAFDCPLAYARNVQVTDQPNTRDCEYQECNYRCLQFPDELIDTSGEVYQYGIPEKDIDTVTYSLYYRSDAERRITSLLRRMFKTQDVLSFDDIAAQVDREDQQVLLFTLESLIDNRTSISGRFGFQSSLQELNNEYFLADTSRSVAENQSTIIIRDDVNLADVVEVFRLDEEKKDVLKVCKTMNPDKIGKIISSLNYRTRIVLLEAAFSMKDAERAKIIIDKMRRLDMSVFEIKNAELIDKIFKAFRKNLSTKARNLTGYIDKLYRFVLTYVTIDQIQNYFIDLRQYIANRRDPQALNKIKKVLEKIEKRVKDAVTSKVTYVHALFSTEPKKTQYKTTLHETGLMRCYNPDIGMWSFCPSPREVEYIDYMLEVTKLGKQIGMQDNPYDVYGTIDPKHDNVFRIVEKGKGRNGFICTSMSDKNRLIRIIINLRDKERELDGATTLQPSISKAAKKMSKKQLLASIEAKSENISKPLKERSEEDLREIEALVTMTVRGGLCPLLQSWLSSKDLIVNV